MSLKSSWHLRTNSVRYNVRLFHANFHFLFLCFYPIAVEINDEQAEKIFTAADAVEFLKTQLDIH